MTSSLQQTSAPVRAGWWRRFFAWWYEILLLIPVLLIVALIYQGLFALLTQLPVDQLSQSRPASWGLFVALLASMLAYFGLCWQRGGQTLAMKAWRIRIVDSATGNSPGRRAILIRFGVALLCFGPVLPLTFGAWHNAAWIPWARLSLAWCILPFVWAYLDRDRQFLHDRLAGTRLLFAPKQPRAQQQQPAEA
ncbi:RDD family protein [Silvimonas sp. JCM 19000]